MTAINATVADALRDRYRSSASSAAAAWPTVYLARDLQARPPVALKVLHPELAARWGPSASSARSA